MHKTLKIKLGLQIKTLRVANKLTQEKLAEKLNMERSNLARIELGKQFPNVENLEKLAKILGVEPKDLFGFGHIKEKEELISEFIEMLKFFDYATIQYIYKSLTNLKKL